MIELSAAWESRKARGALEGTSAVRVFHGPGEGSGELRSLAIDRFGDYGWVTEWEVDAKEASSKTRLEVGKFLAAQGLKAAVWLGRPERGIPNEPKALFGEPPRDRFEVSEGSLRFWIQLVGARHPGLFLDHAPLRSWLSSRARGWKVLNTFAYTGSLSVAAGIAGAAQVTTLDLSKPTVAWAKANWELNGLAPNSGNFIFGDVFEWLPRLKRSGEGYDCVILDPPSFSHGEKGRFSTSKDLPKLHGLAMDLLSTGGHLITSINSASVTWAKYEADILAAAAERKQQFRILGRIDMPDTFPTRLGDAQGRYLKGFILQKVG